MKKKWNSKMKMKITKKLKKKKKKKKKENEQENEKDKEQQSKTFLENKKQLIDQVIIDNKIIKLQETKLKSKRLKLNTHEYYYDRSRRIAVNNNYLCYAVKDTSNREGSIRIINRNNNRHARITGHKKAVLDLCFSSQEDDLLASVSRDGHLNMYMIMEINNEIRHGLTFSVRYTGPVGIKKNPTKYLKLSEEFKQPKGIYTKVIWHPKHQNVLATISTDQTIVIWDVLNFFNNSGKVQVLESSQIEGGTFSLIGHEKPILDISFTPKGDHFVSASMDGTLKIWKYKNEACVKTIIAHDGEPVDSIIYCANPLKCNIESKIKKLVPFCITGGKNNSEIKLWNTETWECLQQLKFIPPELSNKFNTNSFKFAFQLYLNMSSQFLIIADTLRPFIYVLHLDLPKDDDKNKIESENKNNNKNSGRNQLIKFNYISKFMVENPIYNMVLDHQEISKKSKELSSTFNGTNFNLLLFCIKRKSIERYLLKTELCDIELISNKVNLNTKNVEKLYLGLFGNNKDESIGLQSSKQKIINRLLNNLHENSSVSDSSKNTTSSNNSDILTNESIKNIKNTIHNENGNENIKEDENTKENENIKMNKNDKQIINTLENKKNDDDLKIKNDNGLKIDLNINGNGNGEGNGNDNSMEINNSIKSKNVKEINDNKQKEKQNDLNKRKTVEKELKPKINNLKPQSNQKRGNKKETNQGSFFQSLTNNNEKENIKYKPQILNNYNFKKDNNKATETDNFDGNTKIDPKKDIYSQQTMIDRNNKNFIKIRNEENINKMNNIKNYNKKEKQEKDEQTNRMKENEVGEEKEGNGIIIETKTKKREKKMIKEEEKKEFKENETKKENEDEINTIQKNNQKKRKKKKKKFSNVWKKKKVQKTNKNKNQITNTNNNDINNISNKHTKNNENHENNKKMNKKLEIKKINENEQINISKNQKKYNVKEEIIINKTINHTRNLKQLEENFNLFKIECSKKLDQTFKKLDKEQEKIQWMESGQNQEINEIIIQFEKGIKKTVEISFEKFIKKAILNSINKKNHNINSANKNDKVNQEAIEKINKIIQEFLNHDLYFDKIYQKIFAKTSEEFIKILKSPSTKKEVSLDKDEIALMIEQKIMKFAGFSIKNNQNFKIFFKKLKQFNSNQQNSIQNHNDQKNGLLIKNLENYWKLIQNEINNKIQVITKETWSQLEQISNYWKGPQAICKFYISAEMYNESLELILKYEEIGKIETLLLWFFDELKAKGILNLPHLRIKSSVLLNILNILTFNLESNFNHKIDTLLNIILKLNKAQTKFCLQKLNKIMSNLLNLINIYTKQQNIKKIIQLKKTLLLIKSKTNILKKLK
ncbi:enhancer of mRNA-decapping protein [Anaeramoeba flamelloides]|uniref:Enhancer of mRNA-decapping protein n=1 Tax=Anaeramoeba flamelloides TaxID=1746091 RepID=A0AAV7ZRB0_9EUKA|nr:enhancer of mRNA-decapping protein [Anaeramoeba flamelloides]